MLRSRIVHEDPDFAEAAAELVAAFANEAAAPLVVRALADERERVASSALSGVFVAHRAGRIEPMFRDAVAPAVARLANSDDTQFLTALNAPRLLVRLDPEYALTALLKPELLDPTRDNLKWVLAAFNDRGIKIPADRIKPLLNPSHPRVYAEALMALALIGDASAKATLQAALKSNLDSTRLAAAEGPARMEGVVDPLKGLYDRIEKTGFDSLSAVQQRYFVVISYDGEIRNGGHSQYFFNSAGDHWPAALAGLKALGADGKAAILGDVIKNLGEENLVADRKDRNERLARLLDGEGVEPGDDSWAQLKAIGERLDALDGLYFKEPDNLNLRLAQYVLDHVSEFQGGTPWP